MTEYELKKIIEDIWCSGYCDSMEGKFDGSYQKWIRENKLVYMMLLSKCCDEVVDKQNEVM